MNLHFHLPVLGHARGDVVPAERLDHVPAAELNSLIEAGMITVELAPGGPGPAAEPTARLGVAPMLTDEDRAASAALGPATEQPDVV